MRLDPLSRSRGQSLIEFAFLAPVMLLLIVGMIDLGRGFYYQTEITDAARDSARTMIAGSTSSGGPGYQAVCYEAERDLTNIGIGNVTCQNMSAAPPYVAGLDYASPSSGQALALIYCGSAYAATTGSACLTAGLDNPTGCDTQNSPHTCVDVTVVYTFAFFSQEIQQIGGPSLQLSDTAEMVSLW